jgi:CMP/dCMP kinase
VTNSVAGVRPAQTARQPETGRQAVTAGPAAGVRALVVAVDGPSGSGKSSAARGSATALGLRYLDTGAMYRAVTWWMLEHEVDLADARAVIQHTPGLTIQVSTDPADQHVRVDGIDVTRQIRNRRVSNVVSLVAAIPEVRARLIAQQRAIIADAARAGGIVAEGRDIGTVVAPDASVKVFLTASEQVRAERRAAELAGRQASDDGAWPGREGPGRPARHPQPAGTRAEEPPTAAVTRAEQAQRDRMDAPQSQMASDAVQIDATDLALDDVICRIVGLVRAFRRPSGSADGSVASQASR